MTRRGRGAAVAALVLVALVSIAGLAAVAADTAAAQDDTNTTEWSEPGPFERADLQTGGTHDPQAPTSTRAIGSPARGGIAIEHTPLQLLGGTEQMMEPGAQIQSDTLTLFGSTYGDAAGQYELVIVYWNKESTTVDGVTRQYAADQQVQRVTVTAENGYWKTPIQLESHYDDAVQATMWLEQDGERLDGARWRFTHRSNPLTAAPGFSVDGKSDLWRWAGLTILVPAVPGLFIGRRGARHVLDETVVGPQWGMAKWLILFGILGITGGTVLTWQTAAILARAPWVVGAAFTVLSFIAFIGWSDHKTETAQFVQKDIVESTSVTGDDVPDVVREHIEQETVVREGETLFMPAGGILPFIARYWARPAQIAQDHLESGISCTGDISRKFEVDPESDETLVHRAASLSFDPQLLNDLDSPDALTDGGETPPHGRIERLIGRVNWRFLTISIGGFLGIRLATVALTGAGLIGAGLGILPFLAASYRPRDGDLRYEPAPAHFSKAGAILATQRQTYREAQTFEDLHGMVANLDLEVIDRTQETTEAVRQQMREKINDIFNVPDSPEVDAVGSDSDDDGGEPSGPAFGEYGASETETGVGDD